MINPDPEEKPLYYWTNIAVPESPGTRVLTTADAAWRTDYTGALSRVPVPHPDRADIDISHPMASSVSRRLLLRPAGAARSAHRVRRARRRWLRPDVTRGLRVGSCFCGGAVRPARGGRSGSAVRARGTPRSRRDGARRSSSTTGWLVGASVSWTEAFGGVDLDPGAVAGGYADACAAAQASRACGDGPRPPRGTPRALARRGGRRRGRRAGERWVRLGSRRAQAPGRPAGRTDPGPPVPTGRRRQPPGTPPARDDSRGLASRPTGCRCPRSPTAGAPSSRRRRTRSGCDLRAR